jgi:uncharacterized Zn finger protein
MPRLSFFSESAIRQRADGESFRRGQDYLSRGAVAGIVRRGEQITSEVEGSSYAPYQVVVYLDATGQIRAATCTCPYDYGGDCKHIVAVLSPAQTRKRSRSALPSRINSTARTATAAGARPDLAARAPTWCRSRSRERGGAPPAERAAGGPSRAPR